MTLLLVYGGMVLAATWLAMIIWTFRDMRARSRDLLAQIVVAAMVAVLTVPGLLIYMFLRPRETLAEAYERSLEEEALLQDIEEKPSCPGCRQRVHSDWQVCPQCHTRLKKPCPRCGKMLELSWDICPHCAAALTVYTSDVPAPPAYVDSTADLNTGRGGRTASRRRAAQPGDSAAGRGDSLQFVDGE
ncbi:MAG: zinc ribbon domain-containing protein [bacterium]|nr:zinc ribbon domain-containing protein [bacterium]